MKIRIKLIGLMAMTLAIMAACSRQPEPEAFSSFTGHTFNDVLTSLDNGAGDTLILGTENGKLIFYKTGHSHTHEIHVGSDKVYTVRLDTLPDSSSVYFVGVRNEGLKMFRKGDFSQTCIFSYGIKSKNYSVYRVERYGQQLFCSTSNGLAVLDLAHCDSLKPLYPSTSEVSSDYMVKSMQRFGSTLFIAHDNELIVFDLNKNSAGTVIKRGSNIRNLYLDTCTQQAELYVICENSIDIFRAQQPEAGSIRSFPVKQHTHSCLHYPQSTYPYLLMADDRFMMGNSPAPDSLRTFRLTLDKEQHTSTANMLIKNGFIYFISGSTLCQLPDHPSQDNHITSLASSNDITLSISDLNRVYKLPSNGDICPRAFEISDPDITIKPAQSFLQGNHLCLLSDSKVFFQAEKKSAHSLVDIDPYFEHKNITRIYHNPESSRIFMVWRSGFAYATLHDGEPRKEDICKNTDIISIQCFEQPLGDTNTLYIGTLNDGCIVKDLKADTIIRQLYTHLTNIIDVKLTANEIFVLTPAGLYKGNVSDTVFTESFDVRDLHISRISPFEHPEFGSCLLGVSQLGGLYIFQQSRLNAGVCANLWPDIIFYPDAICIQNGTVIAGSSIGLVKCDLVHHSLTPFHLKEPWHVRLKQFLQHNLQTLISIGIPAALALLILIVVLICWSANKTQKISRLIELNDGLKEKNRDIAEENRNLTDEKALLTTENTALMQKRLELEEDIERQKKDLDDFMRARENAKQNVLIGCMFKREWNVGSSRMFNGLSRYADWESFLSVVAEQEKRVNALNSRDINFYAQLDHLADEAAEALATPALQIKACALRHWVLAESSRLLACKPEATEVFRACVEFIVEHHIANAVVFSNQRERETQQLYLRIWAASLLLYTPQPAPSNEENTENDTEKEQRIRSQLKEQRKENEQIQKLLKPQCLYRLLVDEKHPFISEDNFNKKKSEMKKDFLALIYAEQTGLNIVLAFKCHNKFLIQTLGRLFKLENLEV